MDKVQKYNSFNTNTPSSESYRNYNCYNWCIHNSGIHNRVCACVCACIGGMYSFSLTKISIHLREGLPIQLN
jgi:hypothetical protein